MSISIKAQIEEPLHVQCELSGILAERQYNTYLKCGLSINTADSQTRFTFHKFRLDSTIELEIRNKKTEFPLQLQSIHI